MFVNSGHQKGTNVLSAQGNWLMSDKPGLSLRSAFLEIQSTCDILIFYVAHSQDDNCHPQRLSLQTEPRGSGALSGPYAEGFEPPFSENLRWLHSRRLTPSHQYFWFVGFSELLTLLWGAPTSPVPSHWRVGMDGCEYPLGWGGSESSWGPEHQSSITLCCMGTGW